MKSGQQGVDAGARRWQVIPRTLSFVSSTNPTTGEEDMLLIRGSPQKKIWANMYNGLGGHVERSEDALTSARREVQEESGLVVPSLALKGIINIDAGRETGVNLFVFYGRVRPEERELIRGAGPEGTPEWVPVTSILSETIDAVDDLKHIVPRLLNSDPTNMFFGHYTPDSSGTMHYRFEASSSSPGGSAAGSPKSRKAMSDYNLLCREHIAQIEFQIKDDKTPTATKHALKRKVAVLKAAEKKEHLTKERLDALLKGNK